MFAGVSKSGSPTDRLMMSRPAAFSSVASAVIAMVGEGLTRARRSARNGMTLTQLDGSKRSTLMRLLPPGKLIVAVGKNPGPGSFRHNYNVYQLFHAPLSAANLQQNFLPLVVAPDCPRALAMPAPQYSATLHRRPSMQCESDNFWAFLPQRNKGSLRADLPFSADRGSENPCRGGKLVVTLSPATISKFGGVLEATEPSSLIGSCDEIG